MVRALLGTGFLLLAVVEALDYESGITYQSVASFSGAVTIAAGWGFWLLLPLLKRLGSRFSAKTEVDNQD